MNTFSFIRSLPIVWVFIIKTDCISFNKTKDLRHKLHLPNICMYVCLYVCISCKK